MEAYNTIQCVGQVFQEFYFIQRLWHSLLANYNLHNMACQEKKKTSSKHFLNLFILKTYNLEFLPPSSFSQLKLTLFSKMWFLKFTHSYSPFAMQAFF